MNARQWKQIRFFHEDENWGDPALLDFDFIYILDLYRAFLGESMLVSSGTDGKHAQLSLHYSGKAGDFIFPTLRKYNLFECFLHATRFDFSEIGLYTKWRYMGHEVGGLHLGRKANYVEKKYWMCLEEGKYVELSEDNLRAGSII